MKKLLLGAFILGAFTIANAQETKTTSDAMNDIMISPIELIAGPALNFSYERLLNENSGVGINGIFTLTNNDSNFSQISPFYRMYFGKKYAAGFFVEGFVPITTTKARVYIGNGLYGGYYTNSNENITTPGIGFGFGGKWIAKKNILFEASFGIARRFGDKQKMDSQITGKGMLGIGYRF